MYTPRQLILAANADPGKVLTNREKQFLIHLIRQSYAKGRDTIQASIRQYVSGCRIIDLDPYERKVGYRQIHRYITALAKLGIVQVQANENERYGDYLRVIPNAVMSLRKNTESNEDRRVREQRQRAERDAEIVRYHAAHIKIGSENVTSGSIPTSIEELYQFFSKTLPLNPFSGYSGEKKKEKKDDAVASSSRFAPAVGVLITDVISGAEKIFCTLRESLKHTVLWVGQIFATKGFDFSRFKIEMLPPLSRGYTDVQATEKGKRKSMPIKPMNAKPKPSVPRTASEAIQAVAVRPKKAKARDIRSQFRSVWAESVSANHGTPLVDFFSRRQNGIADSIIKILGDRALEFAEWVPRRWIDMVAVEFAWMTKRPPSRLPDLGFVLAFLDRFERAFIEDDGGVVNPGDYDISMRHHLSLDDASRLRADALIQANRLKVDRLIRAERKEATKARTVSPEERERMRRERIEAAARREEEIDAMPVTEAVQWQDDAEALAPMSGMYDAEQ